jgi:hypothetical protein
MTNSDESEVSAGNIAYIFMVNILTMQERRQQVELTFEGLKWHYVCYGDSFTFIYM